ncbi:MAG: ABC transporter ATP-binding protein [Phycisphaerae bacterium]|nr:ABC transporter ATP-binding protein [Phycisphaerae bacterium]
MTRLATPPAAVDGGATRTPAIACQGLTKVFKDFWLRDRARAVDGVSFQIDRGEVFGLLGPNGSGKSTTIKMILGLLRPTKGRIAVFGKSPTDVATKKRIGYLPEESYLYGFLNAEETLDYYGKLFQLDHKTRSSRIGELLDMVGLSHAASRPVRDYSKGMQRRIGLAQALVNDPDLLILDEPTTGLDPIGTRQVKDLIIELGRRGKTVVLSSHLLSDVEDVVDRMVILYGGKIRGNGTCEELLTAKGRTIIDTDELDDATVAEIDRVIRERTGGASAVRSVSKPRQKLEELFLDIVNTAQAERLATSGVTHGGSTAEFLRSDASGDDGASGDAVIADLMREPDPVEPMEVDDGRRAVESDAPTTRESGVDTAAIDELVNDAPAQEAQRQNAPDRPQPSAPHEPADEDVDLGVIGSLIDEDDENSEERHG